MAGSFAAWQEWLGSGVRPWLMKMRHYPSVVRARIYPLSRSQYREDSLARRASYDYLTQIIESSVVCSSWASALATTEWFPGLRSPRRQGSARSRVADASTMREVLEEAERLNALPRNLGRDLSRLAEVRNRVVHDNIAVDEQLALYDEVLAMICAGYASFAAFSALISSNAPDTWEYREIGKGLVQAYYESSQLEPAPKAAALRRLQRERAPGPYTIEHGRIAAYWRLVAMVQRSGD